MTSQVFVDQSNNLSSRNRAVFSEKNKCAFVDQSNRCVNKTNKKISRQQSSFGVNPNGRTAPLYSQSTRNSATYSDCGFQIYDDNDAPDEIISMEIEDDDYFGVPNQTQQHALEIAQHKQTIKDLQNLLKTQRKQMQVLSSERQKYKQECHRYQKLSHSAHASTHFQWRNTTSHTFPLSALPLVNA